MDYRMEALEDLVEVEVIKSDSAKNKTGGCHIFGVLRKPGDKVQGLTRRTAGALEAAGYVKIAKTVAKAKMVDTAKAK